MTDVVVALAALAVRVVAPLADALADPDDLEQLLRDVGWRARVDINTAEALRTAAGLDDALDQAVTALQGWAAQPEPRLDDLPAVTAATAPLLEILRSLADWGQGVTGPPFEHPDFWPAVSRDLPSLLVTRALASDAPLVHGVLLLLGAVSYHDRGPTEPADPERVPYRQAVVDWSAITAFARGPARHVAERYGWGGDLNSALLLESLEAALLAGGIPARREHVDGPARRYFGTPPADARQLVVPMIEGAPADGSPYVRAELVVAPVPASAAAGEFATGVLLVPQLSAGLPGRVPLGGSLHLELSAGAQVAGGVDLAVFPSGARLHADAPDADLDVMIRLAHQPATRRTLLGGPASHRLEVGSVRLSVAASGSLVDGTVDDTEVVVDLSSEPADVAVVLQFGQADGFIGSVFGTEPQVVELGGTVRWSSRTGLRVDGNIGLTVTIPVDLAIGGVRLSRILAGVRATPDGVRVVAALSGSLDLGPLATGIEEVGAALTITPVGRAGGGSSPADLDVGVMFTPPTAVSLALDVPPVKGGGFVLFDPDREQYAGLLHLEIADTVAVTAIALVTTRLADGSKGFSLLVLVSVSGFTPIQLGMGFTLNGVGGLLGLNRSVDLAVLRPGLRTGVLDAVLFPEDPARNASTIVSALSSAFPATRDHFVLGPMAILGWGTPTLVTLKLGLLLEAPSPTRLLLLGRLSVVLPTAQDAVVKIQLDALGVLDFDRGELSLDATLFDSRILTFPLTGDMAMRLGWGVEPQFLVAIGGFNPRFPTPSSFPELRRLSLELSSSQNPRLRFEAYLAVTSNTAQFGARAELSCEAFGFTVAGLFNFDALLQFSPFGFVIDISALLEVRRGRTVLLAVTANVSLSGPAPWRARGTASFRFLLLNVSVSFELEAGTHQDPALPEAVDVRALLTSALADARNWASELPAEVPPLVSFTDPPPRPPTSTAGGGGVGETPRPDRVRVHPLARLTVRQRVVPLDRPITAYGTAVPAAERNFTVTVTGPDGRPWFVASTPVMDSFAPGQYDRLTGDQQLTAPSFVDMQAGLAFSTGALTWPAQAVRERTVSYEDRVVDDLAAAPAPDDRAVRFVPAAPGSLGHVPAEAVTGVVPNSMRSGLRP